MTTKKYTPWFCAAALAPLVAADDLALLSDEFDDPGSIASWQRLYEVEGWGADQLEVWDVDTSVPGAMRLVPHASSWFRDLKGVLVFKEVTGDFVITVKLTVSNRRNPAGPVERPGGSFSLSGIFVHAPRDIVGAPVPVPAGDPVWPPVAYTTGWMPDTDNYIFLSFGRAGGGAGDLRHEYEVKTTRNGNSQLYFAQSGVPAVGEPRRNEVKLQLVRIGGTALVLRQHPGGQWIVENRYPNPDHPFPAWGETLQVGVTAYTDWATCSIFNSTDPARPFFHNYTVLDADGTAFGQSYTVRPDLVSDIDYIRYQRPDSALDEAALEGLATAYDPATNQSTAANGLLPPTGAGALLGDAAHTPLAGLGEPSADTDGDGKAALVEYLYGSAPEMPDPELAAASPTPGVFSFPHAPGATAVAAEVQASASLAGDWTVLATRAAGARGWAAQNGAAVVVSDGVVTVTPGDAGEVLRQFFRILVTAE